MKKALLITGILVFIIGLTFAETGGKKEDHCLMSLAELSSTIILRRPTFPPWCSTIGFTGQNLPAGFVTLTSALP